MVEDKLEDMKRKNMTTDQGEEDIIEMKDTEERKGQKRTRYGMRPQEAGDQEQEEEEVEEGQEVIEEVENTAGRKRD